MRENDDTYRLWAKGQAEWTCLLCGRAAEFCHLKSAGSGGSDYFGYPACHDCHFQRDHTPRGRAHIARQSRWEQALAEWYYNLPKLLARYYLWMKEQGIEIPSALMRYADGGDQWIQMR